MLEVAWFGAELQVISRMFSAGSQIGRKGASGNAAAEAEGNAPDLLHLPDFVPAAIGWVTDGDDPDATAEHAGGLDHSRSRSRVELAGGEEKCLTGRSRYP